MPVLSAPALDHVPILCHNQQNTALLQGGMDTLQKLFADESLSQPLRQKILDLVGDLSSSSLQQEPVGTGCASLHVALPERSHVAC